MPEYIEIRIKGQLNPAWSEWFDGLHLTHLPGNEALLSGALPDQAALHGLLERVQNLNLTLVSLACGRPPASPAPSPTTLNGLEIEPK